jgi:regulator of protease activity HflC (stomatin/prohibitin superfamily)
MDIFWMLFALACLGLIALAVRTACVVPQAHVRNIERLGRYRGTLQAGFHPVIPLLYQRRPLIDLREQVISLREPVITNDKVDLRIETVLFFRVLDPYKADYAIANYFRAIEKLTGTVLRNIVGKIALQDALTSRELINNELRIELNKTALPDWGIQVTRVEVMTIDPPQSVQDAMESRQGEILRAEGQAQAIGKVFAAIHEGDPDQKLLAYEYLEMLPKLAQGPGRTVVVIPSDLTGALKALGGAFGPDQRAAPDGAAKPDAGTPGAQNAA